MCKKGVGLSLVHLFGVCNRALNPTGNPGSLLCSCFQFSRACVSWHPLFTPEKQPCVSQGTTSRSWCSVAARTLLCTCWSVFIILEGARTCPCPWVPVGSFAPSAITACLNRLQFTVGASDRLLCHAQCSLVPLMHLGSKRILVVIPAAKFHWKEQPQAWNNYIWSRPSDCGKVIHNNYSEMSALTISEYHNLYTSFFFILFNSTFQLRTKLT